MTESVVELEDITRNLTVGIREWREEITDVSKEMIDYDFWRWLLTIGKLSSYKPSFSFPLILVKEQKLKQWK